MHSCVYVFIGPNTKNIEAAVARAMSPFDENRAVRPYKLYLSASTVTAISRHYDIPDTDYAGIIARMCDWFGFSGGKDQIGLFARCPHNPDGKWDWYEIGGRFNGRISGDDRPTDAPIIDHNTAQTADLIASPDFEERLPAAIVTPHGEWIAQSVFVSSMSGWHVREETRCRWRERCRRILKSFPDHRVVCIDAHH